MRPEDLGRAGEVFHAALERPTAERETYVTETCGADVALRDQVIALLGAHVAATGYFEVFAERIGETGAREIAAQDHPRVGPYQTLRVIGIGGMGKVFLAERADGQFDQQVALKLVRVGMDSDEGLRRFLAERQIVARLEHPNIARLLDGGVADGRPYFVMEYVDGQPITEYCDAHALPIDERLKLVESAAGALQYAHRNLVVHRDVKPSNILVTRAGDVKLVDFGIAKILGDGPEVAAPVTRTGDRVLTLPYASPEQLSGAPLSTATDVYSLGVVLYELLAGSRPHGQEDAPSRDLERAILEDEPEPPSARVSTPRWVRRLTGDLDTICLKALRKEPDRRYSSPEQLAGDLRRFLEGRPIAARPDSFGYRASKFVRRHAVGVGATAVIAIMLAAFAVFAVVESARTARERDKAQQVADLMVKIFEVADPSEARGATVTAREVLDRGVDRIQAELQSQSDLKATLLSVMGRVYQNLGLWGRASPLYQQALELRRGTLGPTHRDVAQAMNAVGEILRLRGDYKAAEPILRDALALNERVNGPASPEAAESLNHLSKLFYATGKNADAESFARRALQITEAHLGPADINVAESQTNLAAALFAKGDDKDAEPLFRSALAIRRAALGNDHPLVPAALNNLAALLSRKGDFDAAEATHRESLEIYRRIFGPEHPRVATSLNNLGLALFAKKDYAAAEPYLRESLAMRRKLLDPMHAETAQSLANLGLLLQTTGRLAEAEPMYREALIIRRQALGENHPLVAQTINNLGLLLQARGDLPGAEASFRQSLEMLRGQLGPTHPLIATNLHNLATVLVARKRPTDAEPLFLDALAIRRRALPAGHPDTQLTIKALTDLYEVTGQKNKAAALGR